MSISWSLDVDPAPAMLVLPPAAASLDEAHAAIELWEHYSRKRLDPTQRLTVEVMMAETADGRWAASTTGREMPRQNGKGDEIEVVELWGLVQRAEAILHTVHDAVLLASQTQQRMLAVLERPDLRQRVKRKWQGTGQQMIEMRNGGVIWYRTRTGGGGRGVDDIARLVVDEAQHATEEHLAAVAPTLLANSNPQLNAMGTAGLEGRSDWWWSVRKRALAAEPGSFGYIGHTAERISLNDRGRVVQPVVDVQDRSLWRAANPAVTAGRGGGMEFLEEQLFRLGPASFAREHMGVWDPPADGPGGGLFDPAAWADLVISGDGVELEGRPSPVALAVATSQDRQWTHVGLVGMRADGTTRHLVVARSMRGTEGAKAAVEDLIEKWSPVGLAVNPASPAGSLIPELRTIPKVRSKRCQLWEVSPRQEAQAVGMFLDGFAGRTDEGDGEPSLSHQGQTVLGIAVENAELKAVGTAGGQTFDPRVEGVDVAPLQAVTLALFALMTLKSKRATVRASFQ